MLLDSRMASALDALPWFPNRLTIYSRAGWVEATPSGDVAERPEDERVPLAGHTDLHAQVAPLPRPGVGEPRREIGVIDVSSHLALLPAPYSSVDPTMIAVSGTGEIYDIVKIEIDPFTRFTRMELRQTFPAAIAGA